MLIIRIVLSLLAAAAALFLLWLFLALPGRRRTATGQFTGVRFAHRGLHDGKTVPENSIAAFALAIEAGYGIELDVQLSSDGVPMVFHDNTLARVCGMPGSIADYRADELAEFPLSGVAGTGIPRFDAVLRQIDGRVPLLVEIKGEVPGFMNCTELTAQLLDGYRGSYCVESFHPMVLRWFRRMRPQVVRGQLAEAFLRERRYRHPKYAALQLFLLNFFSRPDFIAYNFRHRSDTTLRALHRLSGVPLFAWTPRGEDELAECRDFFALIFENPPRE